jgi:hypothetical protein
LGCSLEIKISSESISIDDSSWFEDEDEDVDAVSEVSTLHIGDDNSSVDF